MLFSRCFTGLLTMVCFVSDMGDYVDHRGTKLIDEMLEHCID